MKFLLDTHTLLWFINGDTQMSPLARVTIEDTSNEIAVSVASLFEISIKLKIGKLSLRKSLPEFISDVGKAWISVTPIADELSSHIKIFPIFRIIGTHSIG